MKNFKGELITGIKELSKPEFGTGETDSCGQPVVNWSFLSSYADEDGFDCRHKESNGFYKMEMELPYGAILLRYGSEMGHFTAPQGTKYEMLSLPYKKESVEYNEYRVISSHTSVICIVQRGIVAPGFGSSGGAVQYLHPVTIRESIKRGLLERLTTWRTENHS